MTPASELVLSYPDIATTAYVGGQSRLDGGMYFGAAVPGGEELCSGIGGYILDGIFEWLASLKAS